MRSVMFILLTVLGVAAAEPEVTPDVAARIAAAEAAGKTDPAAAVKLLAQPAVAAEWFARGTWQARAGDAAGAAASFQQALARMPDFDRARRHLAATLMAAEDDEAAIPQLRTLLDRGVSGRGELWQTLAYAYLRTGRPEAAVAAARQALPWRPDDAELQRLLIAALATADDLEAAAHLAKRELRRQPDGADFWRVLAKADLAAGRDDAALVRLEVMRRLGIADAPLLYALGDLLLSHSLAGEAVTRYREAAALAADDERLLAAIGNLAALGQADAAGELLPLLSETAGKSVAALRVRAELADPATALTLYRDLVAQRPTDGGLLLALGDRERAAGNVRAAAETYARAARLDPTVQRAVLLRQADLAVAAGDDAAAADRVSQALAITPDPALERYLRQLRERSFP